MRLGVPADAALRVTALACFLATALLLFGFVRRFADTLAAFVALARLPVLSVRPALEPRLVDRVPRDGGSDRVTSGRHWSGASARPRALPSWLSSSGRSPAWSRSRPRSSTWSRCSRTSQRRPSGFRGAVRARLAPSFVALAPRAARRSASSGHGTQMRSRRRSELTRWLTSDALRPGTSARSTSEWRAGAGSSSCVAWPGPPRGRPASPSSSSAFSNRRRRSLWLGWAAGGVAGVVVFFNLHVVHDYYQAA